MGEISVVKVCGGGFDLLSLFVEFDGGRRYECVDGKFG